ncbi:peptidoglycan editing factor PgeF [uncultured Bacteroides sp.]|uniref:peptidoglycan editing factor PgeF n=1 Tax=uncultured Bacteroides sp. TaxID=162156 RepID=UPI002AABF2AA|nr:peptidoglycan editing factor PgeF [uncultured Bacteroides sp.]
MISLTKDKAMLGYELLSTYPNIACFVTTRKGGFSSGTYGTFNCSPFSGDEAENIRSNQTKLCSSLPQTPHELIIPFQTHGNQVCFVDQNFLAKDAQARQELLCGVDAVVTNEKGYCLCVSTADCVPILLYDPKKQVIAAVHAGWRGTLQAILSGMLQQMKEKYGIEGGDILACIGPSISLESFEVGEEVYEAFQQKGYDMKRISRWNDEAQKHHLDLWEANRMQLLNFGVPDQQIQLAGICTYINHLEFFSARRLGIQSGRILSGIMLLDQ